MVHAMGKDKRNPEHPRSVRTPILNPGEIPMSCPTTCPMEERLRHGVCCLYDGMSNATTSLIEHDHVATHVACHGAPGATSHGVCRDILHPTARWGAMGHCHGVPHGDSMRSLMVQSVGWPITHTVENRGVLHQFTHGLLYPMGCSMRGVRGLPQGEPWGGPWYAPWGTQVMHIDH